MARKGQASIQDTVETNEEFDAYIASHSNQLICMEVYSEFCGHCLATGNAIRKGKLEMGQERIAMVKAQADNIDALARFKNKSEPVFLFLSQGMLTRAMFGANAIELCCIIEEELGFMAEEEAAPLEPVVRMRRAIEDMLPEEAKKLEQEVKLEEEYHEASERLKVLTLEARKRRVAERAAKHLQRLNYIMFWPHCHQAHYDLYEKWDTVNITVAAKDTFQLDESNVKDALYMSDVDPNEACLHALLTGEVLVVLFKMFETDSRDFVKVLRDALYVDIPVPKDDEPPEKQVPPIPAYERYASISKTAREVRRDRYNIKMEKQRIEQEERNRLAAEQARMAREAEEERLAEEKKKQEEERMRRIQAGLPPEPDPVEVAPVEGEGEEQGTGQGLAEGEGQEEGETNGEGQEETMEVKTKEETKTTTVATETTEEILNTEVLGEEVPDEEQVEAEEEFNSDVEVEGEEYIPPGGLFVPGLYSPLNELAKANGLTLFFPKMVAMNTPIESEFLPPHVLVMFTAEKRHEVLEIVRQYEDEVLALGLFVGEDPYTAEHVAYSIRQYDKMERRLKHKDRLALMVSRKRSLPLLQLAGLNPCYISADVSSGERDCLHMFPVGYGDEFEEEPSVVEEEVVMEVVAQEQEPELEEIQVQEEESEDDEDEED